MPRRVTRTDGDKMSGDSGAELDLSLLDEVFDAGPDANLIALLQRAQQVFGYLPENVIDAIAERVGVPPARVYGIVTFYAQFSTTPSGRCKIHVCQGTACHVAGAPRVTEAFERELRIEPGGTTDDLAFSLETVSCVGACALAPVVRVGDDEAHGRLTPEGVRKLVGDLRRRMEAE